MPITRNIYISLLGVPSESVEAGLHDGFYSLAAPPFGGIAASPSSRLIVGGIPTATAMTIGITTIAAFIGAGGLGDFITQDLSLNNICLILLGAIPAALLAVALDFIIGYIETSLSHRPCIFNAR
ncbi:hypothetical protein [Candidatus Coxiella mudrowiae]|uniref:hypothetical protein n=2 Tax=Candidatus Coxiella mudrowiae TaxID=2054173 RepID=UPI000B022728|nr:hypothetical protein [Candidatus Coxiella mudrowiae]